MHWSGEPFDYAGKHFDARGIIGRPRSLQQPIPIWIGGNAKLTLRRVAERAQGWMPLTGPAGMFSTVRSPEVTSVDDIAEKLATLKELAGDRFDQLDITVAYTDRSVYDLTADVERHREALESIRELGTTWVIVPGPSGPAPQASEFLQGFAEMYIAE